MRFLPAGQLYVSTGPPPGPDVYYYVAGFNAAGGENGESNPGYAPHQYAYGADLDVLQAGVITSIGVRVYSNTPPQTLKFGIYEPNGNLIGESSGTALVNSISMVWSDAPANIPITARTIRVYASASNTQPSYGFITSGAAGRGGAVIYADFPPATDPGTADENRFGFRVFVD